MATLMDAMSTDEKLSSPALVITGRPDTVEPGNAVDLIRLRNSRELLTRRNLGFSDSFLIRLHFLLGLVWDCQLNDRTLPLFPDQHLDAAMHQHPSALFSAGSDNYYIEAA